MGARVTDVVLSNGDVLSLPSSKNDLKLGEYLAFKASLVCMRDGDEVPMLSWAKDLIADRCDGYSDATVGDLIEVLRLYVTASDDSGK